MIEWEERNKFKLKYLFLPVFSLIDWMFRSAQGVRWWV